MALDAMISPASREASELLQLFRQVLAQEIGAVKAMVSQQLTECREEFEERMIKLEERLDECGCFGAVADAQRGGEVADLPKKASASLSQAATRFFRHTEGGNAEPACPSRMVTFANDHDRTWLDGPVAGGLSLFVSGASAEGLPARLGHLRPVPEVPEKTPPPRARGEPEVGEEAGSSEQHSIDMESEGQSGSAQSLGDEPRIEAAKAEAAEMHRSLHHKVAMAAAAVRAAADAAKVAQKERKCTVSPSSTLIDRAEETQGKTTHLVSTSTQTSLSIAAQTTQTSTYVSNAPASWKAQTYVAPLPRSFSVPPPPKVMVAPPRHSTNAAWTPGHPQVLPLPQSPRAVHTPRTPCSTPGTPMPVRWS
eukprot:s864_g14.t1